MNQQQDPVLKALAEIRAKQDETIVLQERMNTQLDQIHSDCKRTARANGAIAGGISGGLVSMGIALIKAKLGM